MKQILLLGSSIISRFTNCKFGGYSVTNKGIPGLITDKMFSKSFLKNVVENNNYDYMILYCGNNDLKEGVDARKVVENIRRFLTIFQENNPSTTIIVLSILTSPYNHKHNLISDIQYINNSLKRVNDIHYININRELSSTKNYLEDGIHLNPTAYDKLNKRISKSQIIKENM
jgi:lysophospholipase L1-like esterase